MNLDVFSGQQTVEPPKPRTGVTGFHPDVSNNGSMKMNIQSDFRDYKSGMNNPNPSANANEGFRTIPKGMEYRTAPNNVDNRSSMNSNYHEEAVLNNTSTDMMRSSMDHVDSRAGAMNSSYRSGMNQTDMQTGINGTVYASGTNDSVDMRQAGGHAGMRSQASAQNSEARLGGGNSHQMMNQEPAISNYIPGPPIGRSNNATDLNVAQLPSSGSFKMQAQSPKASSPSPSLYSSMDRDPRMYSTVENSNSNMVLKDNQYQ
jgi:hypothetical protein